MEIYLHHVAMATRDLADSQSFLSAHGYQATVSAFDVYQNATLVMCTKLGYPDIELVGIQDEASPVYNLLYKAQAMHIFYHMCFSVTSIESFFVTLKERSIPFVITKQAHPATLFNDHRVAFFYGNAYGLIEVVEQGASSQNQEVQHNSATIQLACREKHVTKLSRFFNCLGYQSADTCYLVKEEGCSIEILPACVDEQVCNYVNLFGTQVFDLVEASGNYFLQHSGEK